MTQPYFLTPAQIGKDPSYGLSAWQVQQMVLHGRVPKWALRRTGAKGQRIHISRRWLMGMGPGEVEISTAPAPVAQEAIAWAG